MFVPIPVFPPLGLPNTDGPPLLCSVPPKPGGFGFPDISGIDKMNNQTQSDNSLHSPVKERKTQFPANITIPPACGRSVENQRANSNQAQPPWGLSERNGESKLANASSNSSTQDAVAGRRAFVRERKRSCATVVGTETAPTGPVVIPWSN